MKLTRIWLTAVLPLLLSTTPRAQPARPEPPVLPIAELARENFGADAAWYEHHIPFLAIDDPEIQQIYYYRWKVFRAHVREIGPQGTTVLEFLDDVPWAREPYTDLNDSSAFHLMEARWLRDPRIADALIDHLYSGGGNDRHFSEWIAAATEQVTLVSGDPAPGLRHLDTMRYIFNLWDDHFDRGRNLYWIEPLLDATEYTISSIDASGAGFADHPAKDPAHNGFTGGFAFRPSINSYQFANARAIAHFAALAGEPAVAADYAARAERIRAAVLSQLWNGPLDHFTDRYQRSTSTVHAGDFIRGRELIGYVPWQFELPPRDRSSSTATAWAHLLDPQQLGGHYGLRTVEPSYARYLVQYRYDAATGKPECQWNGPSWPFQTTQALMALANLLHDYPATATVTRDDYVRLLRQYTAQHFLSPGHPDIQEDYDPDTGRPIVGLARSHHYLHSTYIDLVLTGLIGLRPHASNRLELDPLLPSPGSSQRPVRWFAVEHLAYHGHDVGIVYDDDGTHFHRGAGLSVTVDGTRVAGPQPLGRVTIPLGPAQPAHATRRIDLAANPGLPSGPQAAASSSNSPTGPAEAIDGRLWFFPENANGWSPAADGGAENWLAVDLRHPCTVSSVELYFLGDGKGFDAPAGFQLQSKTASGWTDIPGQIRSSAAPIANGPNLVTFPAITTESLRAVIRGQAGRRYRMIEFEAFAPGER